MSPHNLAGEVIGSAVSQLAMLVVSAILIVAVVSAILIGSRALRRRQVSGLRVQTADRLALDRPSITRRTDVDRAATAGSSRRASATSLAI
jgi:hypothetical protein